MKFVTGRLVNLLVLLGHHTQTENLLLSFQIYILLAYGEKGEQYVLMLQPTPLLE